MLLYENIYKVTLSVWNVVAMRNIFLRPKIS